MVKYFQYDLKGLITMERDMTEFNRRLDALADACMNSQRFDQALYVEHDVKRGLRDSRGI